MKKSKRLLITRDKDFGTLIFLNTKFSTGVILLKISPLTVAEVHQELYQLLKNYTQKELNYYFCVVEPHRYRMRRIK